MAINGSEPVTPAEVKQTQSYRNGYADALRAVGKPGNVADPTGKKAERSAKCHDPEKPDTYSCGARDALAAHIFAEDLRASIAVARFLERGKLPFTCGLGAGYRFVENAEECVQILEGCSGFDLTVTSVPFAVDGNRHRVVWTSREQAVAIFGLMTLMLSSSSNCWSIDTGIGFDF